MVPHILRASAVYGFRAREEGNLLEATDNNNNNKNNKNKNNNSGHNNNNNGITKIAGSTTTVVVIEIGKLSSLFFSSPLH